MKHRRVTFALSFNNTCMCTFIPKFIICVYKYILFVSTINTYNCASIKLYYCQSCQFEGLS